jgi:hypothetical protein
MLALVRSEIASELLTRASSYLFAGEALGLRELIRTTMAVDSMPAAQFLGALGIDPAVVPANLNVPSGPSWSRLIVWLLSLGTRLPVATIPDVVDLYANWSSGMVGMDALTPRLVPWLHFWLSEIENARGRSAFGGHIAREKINELEATLRGGFLTFCNRTPQLAVDYLRAVIARPRNERIAESILKYRGTLADAAPAELAELTAASLIRHKTSKRRPPRDDRDQPFSFIDHQFIPESPAQGPFYELLTRAPQYGLPLVRRLVDTAVDFRSGDEPHESNVIVVNFDDGARAFPWRQTYNWSRSGSSSYYGVTSGLLEAWAHKRIESGEDLAAVLGDVLGAPGAPAAYLLVAVDLVISHWPKSAQAAVPFLASPPLLSIDRERQTYDQMPFPDIFGLGALRKEPQGPATLKSLQDRPSRRRPLADLLGLYASGVPAELYKKLKDLLQAEATRLGEPPADADLSDPALMVRHALNLIDPANWTEVQVPRRDGSIARGQQYVSPSSEADHLARLQAARTEDWTDAGIEAWLGLALDDPSKSRPESVKTGIEWAQRQTFPTSPERDPVGLREGSIVTAAMIAMRDGDHDLRNRNRGWADAVFAAVLRGTEDPARRFRGGLRHNPPAIAFAGMVHALKDGLRPGDIRAVLEVAALSDPAAAHGFGSVAPQIAAVDERLPRSLLRCAFAAAIRTRRRWDVPEAEAAEHAERYRRRCAAAVSAELTWLDGSGPEPPWPTFPTEAPRRRPSIRLPGGPPEPPAPAALRRDEYADHQAAALWLANCRGLFDARARPWLVDLIRSYSGWTATANGAGFEAGEELTREPEHWNEPYFDALANCLPVMTREEINELDPIRSLPDERFLDVFAMFVVAVDRVFFNGRGLATEEAVRIRSVLAERLVETGGWRRMVRDKSSSIGMHLGPAAGAMFFNQQGFMQPPAAYLLPKGSTGLRRSFLCLSEWRRRHLAPSSRSSP